MPEWGIGWHYGWLFWLLIIGLIVWGARIISARKRRNGNSPPGDRAP